MSYPIHTKRGDESTAKAHKMLGYKDGGRVKDDGGTNIHISINGTGAKPTPAGADPSALMGALAQAASPPPPPDPTAGMGGPGMGMGAPPIGPGAGPGPIAMRRGGRVKKSAESKAHSKTLGDKIRPTNAPVPPPAKKASGGGVAQLTNASGGAGGGLGRIKKSQNESRNHG